LFIAFLNSREFVSRDYQVIVVRGNLKELCHEI